VGKRPFCHTGKKVGFQSSEVLVFTTLASENAILKINDKGQISYTTVIETVAIKRFVSASRKRGLVQKLGRTNLNVKKREGGRKRTSGKPMRDAFSKEIGPPKLSGATANQQTTVHQDDRYSYLIEERLRWRRQG
jgi:hypothetical protein